MHSKESETELSMMQFIPRGAYLRNSNNVIALIVYTGIHTKMIMN